MTITSKITYSFDNPREIESIREFQNTHDMSEWVKREDTQAIHFTKYSSFLFCTEDEYRDYLDKLPIKEMPGKTIELPKWEGIT